MQNILHYMRPLLIMIAAYLWVHQSTESAEPTSPGVAAEENEAQSPSADSVSQPECNPEQTFFQNDWDGNDRDNRYVARDWKAYDLGRFATALTDPKNTESAPASVAATTFAEGARLVAAATQKGKVNLIMKSKNETHADFEKPRPKRQKSI